MKKEGLAFRIHEYLRNTFGGGSHIESASIPKEYPRMRRVELPRERLAMPLSDALSGRASAREFETERHITSKEIGALLATLAMQNDMRRPYPSGGARYPIEIYLAAQRVTDIRAGVHHYVAGAHALEYLWKAPPVELERGKGNVYFKPFHHAAALVIFTGIWDRSAEKYGDFGYLLALLEAGHMAQNILLAASALNIDARPIAGFSDEAVSSLLDLDTSVEQPVYIIALGAKR